MEGMARRRHSLLIRLGFAVVAVALLSAFSCPLVREGYEHAGSVMCRQAQQQMLRQAIDEYLQFNNSPGWTVNTSTLHILNDLALGVDRSFRGRPESLLPSSQTPESLAKDFRIIYKGPQSYKVIVL